MQEGVQNREMDSGGLIFRKHYPRTLFSLDGSAFAGDEDGSRRCDIEFFRVVALVAGDADAATGIDVEQRIADRDVHEGFDMGERDELFVDLDTDSVAEVVAELLKFIAGNVGDQRAVGIVEADDVAFDAFFCGDGNLRSKADELGNFGADEIEIPAGDEMRGSGRENIAAVKRRRNGSFDHPGLVGDFTGGCEAVAVEHGRDQAVIGKNKKLTFPGFDDDGFAGSADAGVDNDEEYGTRGIVGSDVSEEARGLFDLLESNLVREVHDAH